MIYIKVTCVNVISVTGPSAQLNLAYLLVFLEFVAGDITDAKLEDREGSRQFEDEWKQYDRVLQETGILDKTVWLDTRGNHGVYHVYISLVIESTAYCLVLVHRSPSKSKLKAVSSPLLVQVV